MQFITKKKFHFLLFFFHYFCYFICDLLHNGFFFSYYWNYCISSFIWIHTQTVIDREWKERFLHQLFADWSIIKSFIVEWKTFIYQIKWIIFHIQKKKRTRDEDRLCSRWVEMWCYCCWCCFLSLDGKLRIFKSLWDYEILKGSQNSKDY